MGFGNDSGNLYFARAHALCQKLHRNRMACRGSNRFVYFDTVPDCLDSVYRKIVGSIRRSKLSGLDRMLGLFFGIARACLLVILFYILISWMIPVDKQSDTLRESKYFQIAGSFAKPIEELIPESTLEIIREKTKQVSEQAEKADREEKAETEAKQHLEEQDETDELFEKLAQPQIKKKSAPAQKEKLKKPVKIEENFDGYKESERDNLDRLIENTME